MNVQTLKENISGIDIYLLDQILKDRYKSGGKILDAGCGNGRNLKWFYQNNIEIHGIDTDKLKINYCKDFYKSQQENFIEAKVYDIPYVSNYFDHVICNAVLHFAKDFSQYSRMFEELLRILKPQGSLFIRIASNFGIESQVELISNGLYKLPDGSTRFLLTQEILNEIEDRGDLTFLENVKTTIVHNQRSMTTLVFKKE
jgi:tellurite methyltransferase